MIIVQTPLRISLFGGGTDFSSYFREEGGCVLSTAINKYVFVVVRQRYDEKLRIGYTSTEMVDSVNEIQHELIRESLRKTGIVQGVEITTMADLPAGTGLGSSSAVTVGALNALYAYKNEFYSAGFLAKEASDIEVNILNKPIGVQDHYITAYGGLRFIEFCKDGQVVVDRIEIPVEVKRRLSENLMVFFTGVTRSADTILAEQQNNINSKIDVLNQMKQMAIEARDQLCRGNINSFGPLLHESWQLKKQLASKISNDSIEESYNAALKAGALGGKISGAGGGGFLLLYCPYEKREAVRQAMHAYEELPIQLEPDGSKVIFNYRR